MCKFHIYVTKVEVLFLIDPQLNWYLSIISKENTYMGAITMQINNKKNNNINEIMQ